MTILKLSGEVAGGHVHARMFMGPHEHALGKCGDIHVRVEEWEELRESLSVSSDDLTVIIDTSGPGYPGGDVIRRTMQGRMSSKDAVRLVRTVKEITVSAADEYPDGEGAASDEYLAQLESSLGHWLDEIKSLRLRRYWKKKNGEAAG